jgi:hypothetical protein
MEEEDSTGDERTEDDRRERAQSDAGSTGSEVKVPVKVISEVASCKKGNWRLSLA